MRWLAVVPLLLAEPLALCDHLPDNLVARGKPEKFLANIYVDVDHGSHPKALVATLGKPFMDKKPPASQDCEEMAWIKNGSRIHVNIGCAAVTAPDDNMTISAEVSGTPSDLTRTGAGLNLGNTLEDVTRIYGRRFGRSHQDHNEVNYEWKDGTMMRITLLNGRVAKILLMGALE